MEAPQAELEFELICRTWNIGGEKKPAERPPEHVEHDIYAVPDAPGAIPSRRHRSSMNAHAW